MKKLLIGLTLCAALTLCLLTSSALAAEPTKVMVGNTDVTTGYETAKPLYSGTVQYAYGRLTLRNMNVTDSHSLSGDDEKKAAISADGDLVIHFTGASTVAPPVGGKESYGIHVDGTLAVTGEAGVALTVNGANAESGSYGIFASSSGSGAAVLINTDGKVTANAGVASASYGIYGENTGSGTGVHLGGGAVEAIGGGGNDFYRGISIGIYGAANAGDGVLISGTNTLITAAGGNDNGILFSYGISGKSKTGTQNAGVRITGDVANRVTAVGGAADTISYGIYGLGSGGASGVVIAGGTISKAEGGDVSTYDSATICASAGIYGEAGGSGCKGGVLIGGSAVVTDAHGGNVANNSTSSGIFGQSAHGVSVKISDSASVTASSESINIYASYSCGIFGYANNTADATPVEISGGTVSATGGSALSSCGVYGENEAADSRQTAVVLSGGTLTADGGAGEDFSCGIEGDNFGLGDGLAISGGTVTARGGESDRSLSAGVCGVILSSGSTKNAVAISGGVLAASGGTGSTGSNGIYAVHLGLGEGVAISGGTVTASGGSSSSGYSYGVSSFTYGTLITGGTTTATGGLQAFYEQPSFGAAPENEWYMWKENTAATEPSGGYTESSATSQFTNYTTAKYLKVVHVPYVSVGDVTVSGNVGTALTEQTVTLTLSGDTFKSNLLADIDVSSWFTSRPADVSAKLKTAVSANDTTATVAIHGTPTAVKREVIAVTIPAASLTGGKALTANANANAVWSIRGTVQAQWSNATETDAKGTLTEAVDAANATPNTTIKLLTDIDADDFWLDATDASLRAPFFFFGQNTTLDLNGKTIDKGQAGRSWNGNVLTVNADASLTVKDTGTGGRIKGGRSDNNGGGVIVEGSFTLQGGTITENYVYNEDGCGGGVYVCNGGSLIMTGGKIENNQVYGFNGIFESPNLYGGGVGVEGAGSAFTMNGGTISGNRATRGGGVSVNAGTFTMSGTATIARNIADSSMSGPLNNIGNGGGVYVVNNGIFNMSSGVVGGATDADANIACIGGGMYVGTGGAFTLSGTARIEHNTTGLSGLHPASFGGGVHIAFCSVEDPPYTSEGASGNFIMKGGTISGNSAYNGGGVCNAGITTMINDTATPNGGTISGNTAVSMGGGICTISEDTFIMTHGRITGNTVTGANNEGNGGGVFVTVNNTFDMRGGEITDNVVNGNGVLDNGYRAGGGGVCISGTFIMSGNASIRGNAASHGGGVLINRQGNSGGACSLTGGEITGNRAEIAGGGVYVGNPALSVSGAPTVSGNKGGSATSNVVDNVYLPTGALVKAKTALTGGSIGITTQANAAPIRIAQGDGYALTSSDSAVFHSDVATFGVEYVAAAGSEPAYARLAAKASPVVTLHPIGQTVLAGQKATFTIAATGFPAPTYQWQLYDSDNENWIDLPGATGDSYTTEATTPDDNGALYRCVVSNSVQSGVLSRTAILTVTNAPVFDTQPTNQTVVAGQKAVFIAIAVSYPDPTLQWQVSTDSGATWTDISDATGQVCETPVTTASDDGKLYRCIAKNGVLPDAVSDAAKLTVRRIPADPPASLNRITGILSGQTFTKGETITFTAVGGGMDNDAPITGDKRWRANRWATNPSGDFGAGYTQRFSTTDMTLGAHTLTVTFNQQQYDGAAWADTGETDARSVPFTLVAALKITAEPTDQTTFVDEKATFSVTAAGDGLTYQWFVNRQDGRGWQKLEGSTASKHVTTQTTLTNDGYRYYCHIGDAHGNTADSKAVTLHVKEVPVTGDNAVPGLWLALLLLCGIGLIITVRRKRA